MEVTLGSPKSPTVETVESVSIEIRQILRGLLRPVLMNSSSAPPNLNPLILFASPQALLDSASASANEIEPTIDSSKSKSGPITLQTNGDNPMGSSVQLQTGSPPADQPASTLNPTDESSSSNLLTIGHLPDRQNPTSCNGSGVSNVDYLKPGGSPADAPTNQINDIVLPENPLPLEDTSFLDTVPLEESNFDLGEGKYRCRNGKTPGALCQSLELLSARRSSIDDQLNDGIDGDSDVGETKLEAETTEDLQECVQAINEAEKKEAEPEESRSEGVGNDTATCNDVNQAAGAGESRPEEVCSKETSLGEAKVEPDGKECAGQVRHTEEARSAESMGETKEYAVRQESAAGVQPNGLRDEEVAQDIETMRSNIVEAMDDFQTRIDEAKEIKLNLENLLRNLNSIKSIDVQNKDLRAGE